MNHPEKTAKQPSSFQFRIDLILTVLFLAAIFFMGIMTVVTDFDGLHNAFGARARVKSFMKDPVNYSQWDFLEGRIRSLDDYLSGNVYKGTELGHNSASFQYALGKRIVTTGGSQMVRLTTGHLHDLQSNAPMDAAVQKVCDMRAIVPEGTPFLYVYEHPMTYDPAMFPEGYEVLDYNDEIADEIVARIAETGMDYIDSREILLSSGYEPADYLMRTDQHWATRAALIMSGEIARQINARYGFSLDAEALNLDRFEETVYPGLFLGKYGQRIGTRNIEPDDISIFTPKYETNIKRYTNYLDDITEIEGPFADSVIRWKYMELEPGESWNIKAYFNYGLTENFDHYTNENGGDCTILLAKDSFAAPIGAFLSLAANEVWGVDFRRSELTLAEWIERVQPDIVVVSYSQLMLRQDKFEFR